MTVACDTALSAEREAEIRAEIRAAGYIVGKLVRYLHPIDPSDFPEVLFIGYPRKGPVKAGPLRAFLPRRDDETLVITDGW
jgi:hypothetical protein